MERAHLESEIQQVPPPLLGHPSAGVLSSRGWGLTAPCDESQSHPSRPTRSTPVSWKQREDRVTGSIGVDRSKTPPPHVRGSESILSRCLPPPHPCRHVYARLLSSEDGYRNSLPVVRLLRDLRLRRRRGGEGD